MMKRFWTLCLAALMLAAVSVSATAKNLTFSIFFPPTHDQAVAAVDCGGSPVDQGSLRASRLLLETHNHSLLGTEGRERQE